MNLSTRRASWRAISAVISLLSGMAWLTFGSLRPASAEVLIRLVNGRELVVREHWFTSSHVWFTQGRGTVGVPRELVAAIAAVDAPREIGGGREAVNATPLVAPSPIR